MLVIWPQSQFDEGASIGSGFGLPIVVRLISLHGLLRRVIPHAGRFPRQVVFANQGLLDFQGAFRVNLLLSTRTPVRRGFPRSLTFPGGRACRSAGGLGSFRVRTRGGIRGRGRLLGRGLAGGLAVLGRRQRCRKQRYTRNRRKSCHPKVKPTQKLPSQTRAGTEQ